MTGNTFLSWVYACQELLTVRITMNRSSNPKEVTLTPINERANERWISVKHMSVPNPLLNERGHNGLRAFPPGLEIMSESYNR